MEGVSALFECINLALLQSNSTSILSITSPVRICLEPPNSRFVMLLLRKEAILMFLGNKGGGESLSEKKLECNGCT